MTPDEITLGVIAAIAIWFGWRNPTTVVLALSYLLPKLIMWLWGWGFGPVGAFRVDLAIIMLIYALKPSTPHPWCRSITPRDGYRYRSFAHHICSHWLERTPADRLVLLCFPFVWVFYGVSNETIQWWGLISVWLVQLGISFWESIELRLSSRREANAVPDKPEGFSGVEFAWAHGGGGDG